MARNAQGYADANFLKTKKLGRLSTRFALFVGFSGLGCEQVFEILSHC
jgi:hypothetical protein